MSTPLMQQYRQVKSKYPDTILLFRMGDFFETFEEDAKTTSRVLGITLTRRGNGAAGEVPLAGFPHHALETYLPKLLKAGYRVAVCEQLEDPKFAKGIVKRDVIEVVTPGVSFSEKVLDQRQNNFLAAIALPSPIASGNDIIGFAHADVSTGEFMTAEFPLYQLKEQIAVIAPSELLVQKRDLDTVKQMVEGAYRGIFSKVDDWVYTYDYAYEVLLTHFKTQSLKGFGCEELRVGVIAAGAIMNYLQETQKANLLHIKKLMPENVSEFIILDASTKRNLEITSSIAGTSDGTLFSVIDKTQTSMGSRLLKQWVNRPLKNLDLLKERLLAVDELTTSPELRRTLVEILSTIGDLERLIAKICTNRATPRELIALKSILKCISELKSLIAKVQSGALKEIYSRMQALPSIVQLIDSSIADDPPATITEGNVIRSGYNTELDELRTLAHSGKEWIAKLQKTERERTGISSLKVGFNNVFGYYIEITNTHKEKIPSDYIRKQTLANAERFITPELKEYEDKILHAEEKINALETELFNSIRLRIAEDAGIIQENARLIATLDCFVSLASTAVDHAYIMPQLDNDTTIEIHEGRHPVIEQLLPPGERYIPNDTKLDTADQQILIITGPNMSGKSSYLRQVGLICLLAQIGSFVPAKFAHIGLVDRIYTRVGASDNIASGESTFLVEMHEAANIVNTATEKSLILLDEIGRGTSTFDGISIAWSLTEYLHERIGAKTLFATHYHELNELADIFPRIKNYKVDVREYGDKVVFLHKVTPGFADHSYGIQVAMMAGLPEELTNRAKKILKNLEGAELSVQGEQKKHSRVQTDIQMTLFEIKDEELRERIRTIDVDSITPLEALQILAGLKKHIV